MIRYRWLVCFFCALWQLVLFAQHTVPADSTAAALYTDSLLIEGEMIDEVLITAKRRDVVVKGDTTVINANAFKTPEGAYLEELLKRIPGLSYNPKTKELVYNGHIIQEIRINGENFFAGNKEIALENFPANLVGKLKVYDKRKLEEDFIGMDDGQTNYVLDLETRREINNNWLLSAKLGAGSKRKKELEGQAHFFRGNGDNLSLMFRSSNRHQNSTYKNNINRNVGLNTTKKMGEDFTLTGSLNHANSRYGNLFSTYQEQYLVSGNLYNASEAEHVSKNRNVVANVFGEGKISNRTMLHFMANGSFSRQSGNQSGLQATFDEPPLIDRSHFFDNLPAVPEAVRLNLNDNRMLTDGDSYNYMWSASVIHKLDSMGKTTLQIGLNNSHSRGNQEQFSLSTTTYYRLKNEAGNDSVLLRHQYQDMPTSNNHWQLDLSFTRLLSRGLRMQGGYAWSKHYDRDYRHTYELSSFTSDEALGTLPERYREGYVDSLSDRSRSCIQEHIFNLGLHYSDTTWTANASVVFIPRQRSVFRKIGKLSSDTTLVTFDVMPRFWLAWKKRSVHLDMGYDFSMQQPSLSLLMPLTDNSDPLHVTRGNADLKKMSLHNFRLSFQHQKWLLSGSIGGRVQRNSFTQVVKYNPQTGGRESYPVNINGNWGVDGRSEWYKTLPRAFSVRTSFNVMYDHRVALVTEGIQADPQRSTTRSSFMSVESALAYQPSWGRFDFRGGWHYQYALNSLGSRNNSYLRNWKVAFDAWFDLPGGIQLRSDIHCDFRGGTNVQHDDAREIRWNASLLYHFLKKQAEVSAVWADILSKRRNFTRTVSADGLMEYRSQEINAYFFFSFKYNFRAAM